MISAVFGCLAATGLVLLGTKRTSFLGKEGMDPTKLTVHSDRGSSMTSKPVAFTLADLGVTKSHSRPHVSAVGYIDYPEGSTVS
jgi:hypothetical protein